MNEIVQVETSNLPLTRAKLPAAKVDINIRAAVECDIPAIDKLQKSHGKQLGFMNRPTLEGKVKLGHVLVAEAGGGGLAGYLIGNDRYKHRDELGVIFQLCVADEYRRSFVGANLLKAQFERSAYGCRLYCCWCAQDIEANRFWESMGFVPLAYRAGSEKRKRVHIFWQKRIREGDATTPWWFPSMTAGGAMDAARIALPIPTGLKWSDELPRLVVERPLMLEAGGGGSRKAKKSGEEVERCVNRSMTGGLWFRPRKEDVKKEVAERKEKKERVKKLPDGLAGKARELRDRWLEHVNENEVTVQGKYDVRKAIVGGVNAQIGQAMQTQKLLEDAA